MLSNRFQCGPPMTSYCGAEWPRAMILLLAEASAARIESTSVSLPDNTTSRGAVAGREDAADVAALLVAERFVPTSGISALTACSERRVGVLAVNQYDPAAAVERPGEFAYFRAGSGAIWKEGRRCAYDRSSPAAKRPECPPARRCAGRVPVRLRTRGRRSVASGRECCRRRVSRPSRDRAPCRKRRAVPTGRRGGAGRRPAGIPDRIRYSWHWGARRSWRAAATTSGARRPARASGSFFGGRPHRQRVGRLLGGGGCIGRRQLDDRTGFERCGRKAFVEFRERLLRSPVGVGERIHRIARSDDV